MNNDGNHGGLPHVLNLVNSPKIRNSACRGNVLSPFLLPFPWSTITMINLSQCFASQTHLVISPVFALSRCGRFPFDSRGKELINTGEIAFPLDFGVSFIYDAVASLCLNTRSLQGSLPHLPRRDLTPGATDCRAATKEEGVSFYP